MTEVTYREAINRALADELDADDSVFVFGEDVAAAGGVFKVTDGLLDRFGPERVYDTPISEQAIIGTAIGAAVMGLRPVAEIMFADFAGVCFDGIANELAKYRYMSGGQVSVPVTIRMANGASVGFAAQHSQGAENWFLGIPGLKVCTPGTPGDAYRLLRAAIRDPDPVLYFEHKALYNTTGPVDGGPTPDALGRASTVRTGSDVTVVANQLMRARALTAADQLASDGISVEVIDPLTLIPLDVDTVLRSVERTHRLVVVQESCLGGSWGATLVARICADAFELLDAPPAIIGGDDTPIPYAESLESAWLPSIERIVDDVRTTVAY